MNEQIVVEIPITEETTIGIAWPELVALGSCCILPLFVGVIVLVAVFATMKRKS